MGIINSIGNLGDKAYDKISTALVVKDPGPYLGDWDYDPYQGCFTQVESGYKSPFHTKSEEIKKFYVSAIKSIEVLSSSKDTKGITKAALGGALLGGGVGAVAGGLFAASKNSLFVAITFKNEQILHAYVSQNLYERILVLLSNDNTEEEDNPAGITISKTEGVLSIPIMSIIMVIVAISFIALTQG